MPIYEYQCQRCHHAFEFLEGLGSGDNTPCCPKCHSRSASRVFSRFSFFDSSNSWRSKDGAMPAVPAKKEVKS